MLKSHRKTKRNMIKLTRCMINKSTVLHVEKEHAKCVHNGLYISLIIYTYIIGHYNPSVRIIDLPPLMLCVSILYISDGTYSLKSTPNDRFFEKLFLAIFIHSQSFCQKSAERGNCRRNTFRISFGLALKPRLFV